MINKTDLARQSFDMNDAELARAIQFAEKHTSCHSKVATGEKFAYTFVPDGVGTAIIIKCMVCGEDENITDFDLRGIVSSKEDHCPWCGNRWEEGCNVCPVCGCKKVKLKDITVGTAGSNR